MLQAAGLGRKCNAVLPDPLERDLCVGGARCSGLNARPAVSECEAAVACMCEVRVCVQLRFYDIMVPSLHSGKSTESQRSTWTELLLCAWAMEVVSGPVMSSVVLSPSGLYASTTMPLALQYDKSPSGSAPMPM